MAIAELPELLDALVTVLFEAETRRIDGLVTELDKKNREIQGHKLEGFTFKGAVYIPTQRVYKPTSHTMFKPLCFSLLKEGNHLVNECRVIQWEKQSIKQTFYKMLFQCADAQEIRDALPDCVANLVPALAKIPRKLPEGILWQSDNRTLRQIEAMIPKIEFYAATRLLY
jgi:hypothetical protein